MIGCLSDGRHSSKVLLHSISWIVKMTMTLVQPVRNSNISDEIGRIDSMSSVLWFENYITLAICVQLHSCSTSCFFMSHQLPSRCFFVHVDHTVELWKAITRPIQSPFSQIFNEHKNETSLQLNTWNNGKMQRRASSSQLRVLDEIKSKYQRGCASHAEKSGRFLDCSSFMLFIFH